MAVTECVGSSKQVEFCVESKDKMSLSHLSVFVILEGLHDVLGDLVRVVGVLRVEVGHAGRGALLRRGRSMTARETKRNHA